MNTRDKFMNSLGDLADRTGGLIERLRPSDESDARDDSGSADVGLDAAGRPVPGSASNDLDGGPATSPAARAERWPEVAFDDRMSTVEFRIAPDAHIVVDAEVCRSCTTRACVTACPANLFAPTSDGGILFNYEECFECGTCYMLCNSEGAISWSYPEGGQGVVFHRA